MLFDQVICNLYHFYLSLEQPLKAELLMCSMDPALKIPLEQTLCMKYVASWDTWLMNTTKKITVMYGTNEIQHSELNKVLFLFCRSRKCDIFPKAIETQSQMRECKQCWHFLISWYRTEGNCFYENTLYKNSPI